MENNDGLNEQTTSKTKRQKTEITDPCPLTRYHHKVPTLQSLALFKYIFSGKDIACSSHGCKNKASWVRKDTINAEHLIFLCVECINELAYHCYPIKGGKQYHWCKGFSPDRSQINYSTKRFLVHNPWCKRTHKFDDYLGKIREDNTLLTRGNEEYEILKCINDYLFTGLENEYIGHYNVITKLKEVLGDDHGFNLDEIKPPRTSDNLTAIKDFNILNSVLRKDICSVEGCYNEWGWVNVTDSQQLGLIFLCEKCCKSMFRHISGEEDNIMGKPGKLHEECIRLYNKGISMDRSNQWTYLFLKHQMWCPLIRRFNKLYSKLSLKMTKQELQTKAFPMVNGISDNSVNADKQKETPVILDGINDNKIGLMKHDSFLKDLDSIKLYLIDKVDYLYITEYKITDKLIEYLSILEILLKKD